MFEGRFSQTDKSRAGYQETSIKAKGVISHIVQVIKDECKG